MIINRLMTKNQLNKMKMEWQTLMVLCLYVTSTVGDDYENKLTKLWSLSRTSNSDRSAVLNVTSASIVIPPNSVKTTDEIKYAFKPRAIPLNKQQTQIERNVYYSQDNVKQYKTEKLFPGNYVPIVNVKSRQNVPKEKIDEQGRGFETKPIPLIHNVEFQRRSLDVIEQPIIEKPDGFEEAVASRRSISYLFGVEDDGDDAEDEDNEKYEVEETDGTPENERQTKNKKIKKALKPKKLKKYMLPLLLAYKMKYFALIPVMIGGLILLVGATGLAGFFFALFAAVMGLQKGAY